MLSWFRSPPAEDESASTAYYPSDFEKSDIASTLKRIGDRLWPGDGPEKKAEGRRVLAWESLRRDVYSRVYRRTGPSGKQAIHNELQTLLKSAATGKITCNNLQPLLDVSATTHGPATTIQKERDVLIDCDATVVGYLDAVREIVRERDYHHFQEAEADLRSIWVNEEKGFCPFWALMTAQERVSVLSELDHAVSVVEHLTGSVKAGQGQERLHTVLHALREQGLEFRKRTARPQVFEHHREHRRNSDSHYASLSHPLLGQPLTPRKARIYGLP